MPKTSHKIYRKISAYLVNLIDKARKTEHIFMIVVAIIIGSLAGFGAVGIRALIKIISDLSFPGVGSILSNITASGWLRVVIVPIIGGLIVGPLIYIFAQEAKGHGVPEVMQAILLKGGVIRKRVAFIKALASSITIGTGGSVGREGPIVQIGASIGSTIGQLFRIPGKRIKTMVGCGAAAGIAAAFNAPIAGALFAVEIILMDFAITQFSPIVISSVIATVISHHFEGNFAAFAVPKYLMQSPFELILYTVLGLLCGLLSFAFIRILYNFEDFFDYKFKFPEYLKPALGGLVIGVTALQFPQVMGVGYDSINLALKGEMIWSIALALIFVKVLATSITLGSGGSGGIFAPSLFMGAMLGVFFGLVSDKLFPGINLHPGAYALVAMGGMVAGTTRGPITAIIIVFELTNDYKIILPLMITCIISTLLSSKLSRESIYTLKLLLRNINIHSGAETNILKSIYVSDIYSTQYTAIPHNTTFDQIVSDIISKRSPYLFVMGKDKRLTGVISLNNIKDHLFDKEALQHLVIASDLALKDYEEISLHDNCQAVVEKMNKTDYDFLPVVNPKIPGKMIGLVWRKDIDDAYNKEIERIDIASDLASKIKMNQLDKNIYFMEGYAMSEIRPPREFLGKSIKELDIRARFGVNILSIRRNTRHGSKVQAIPDPDHIINADDTLIIAGEIPRLDQLKNLS